MAIPSFRNVRALTLLALIGTTYTSWYMIGSSWAHGLKPYAATLQPTSIENIFAATSNILFTFGGHCMLLEVLDSQFRPSNFPKTFTWAHIYVVSTLTLPNAVFTFLAYPEESLEYGNAFAIFPDSSWKSLGILRDSHLRGMPNAEGAPMGGGAGLRRRNILPHPQTPPQIPPWRATP